MRVETSPRRGAREPGRVRRFLVGRSDRGARWPALSVAFAVAVGALAGVGAYTFEYAEGLSYFTTDPAACANCHIMQPEYDAWAKSSHHAAAVCVDCHLPAAFIPKYLAKAENGWRHGKLFTTGGFHEPIQLQELGKRILQQNCERCHAEVTDEMRSTHVTSSAHPLADYARGDNPLEGQVQCIHCHSAVGHGARAGVGGPLTEEEMSVDGA